MTRYSNEQMAWEPYMRLGINHHLLFPAAFESVEAHHESLHRVLAFPQFEFIDMFVLRDGELFEKEREMVSQSGKRAIYNCPLFLTSDLNPNANDPQVRENALHEAEKHVNRAKKLGAVTMIVASGPDPDESQRQIQREFFAEYLEKLCRIAGPGFDILIEPFDRSIGKNLLIGPTKDAVSIVEEVQRRGCDNIGLLMDMGHVPLMEETFAHALATATGHVKHVHLGSCVMRDSSDPLYGDMHPPWGYPGGENDVPELIEFLRCLFAAGYLGQGKRPSVTLEMRPYPDKTEEESVAIFMNKLEEAWRLLGSEVSL